MRLKLDITIAGNDSLEKKFMDSIQNDPEMTHNFLRSIMSSAIMAFRITPEDNLNCQGFTISKQQELASDQPQPQKDVEIKN